MKSTKIDQESAEAEQAISHDNTKTPLDTQNGVVQESASSITGVAVKEDRPEPGSSEDEEEQHGHTIDIDSPESSSDSSFTLSDRDSAESDRFAGSSDDSQDGNNNAADDQSRPANIDPLRHPRVVLGALFAQEIAPGYGFTSIEEWVLTVHRHERLAVDLMSATDMDVSLEAMLDETDEGGDEYMLAPEAVGGMGYDMTSIPRSHGNGI